MDDLSMSISKIVREALFQAAEQARGEQATVKRLLLDEREVGELLGIASKTLGNWRSLGKGPPFIKLGALVRYRPDDVQAWVDSFEERPDH